MNINHLLKYYLRRIILIPPRILIRKITTKAKDKAKAYYSRKCDRRLTSFASDMSVHCKSLNRLLGNLSQDILKGNWGWLRGVSQNYLSHRFDLLGSGWVGVYHGMCCRGLEGYRFDMGSAVNVDREGRWLKGRINPANLKE